MYSAWHTSWISGIAAVVVAAAGIAVQLSVSTTPEPLPVLVMVVTSLVAAAVVGGAMTLTVRSGLHLAGCRHLTLRFVLIVPTVSLLLLSVLATTPMETHAVVLDLRSKQSSSIGIPLVFWLSVVGAILIPLFVSYVVGRLARGAQQNR